MEIVKSKGMFTKTVYNVYGTSMCGFNVFYQVHACETHYKNKHE